MLRRRAGEWWPDVYVLTRFLEALRDSERPLSRTELQSAVGVNWDVLRRYLDFLGERDLVHVRDSDGGASVTITKQGRAACEEILDWLDRVFGR